MMKTHCEACGSRLWSDHSKAEGIHPDCKYPDFEDALAALDLEDRLELALAPKGVDSLAMTG